jgi:protein-disulfide isomerase
MGISRVLTILSIGIALAACGGSKTTSAPAATGDAGIVVATINGAPVTDADLTAAASDELKQFDMQIYKIKKNALDTLIEGKIIEEAAKKDGKSVEDYVKINIDDKVKNVSDDEMKAFYEQHKDQVGGKSFDEVKESISQYMNRRSAQDARSSLIAQLKKDAKVEISLEPPRVAVEAGDNPSKGPKNAPITIIEFTDYECPFCGRVRPTVDQILSKYKDQVRYVLRDYPLPFHGNAKKAGEAAHCAGDQNKYWEMSKILFQNQKALSATDLKKYAKDIGLNQAKFDKCLDSGKYAKKVDENLAAGGKVGVNGTPAFFINGVMLSGAQPIDNFTVIIDAELAKKK